MSFFNRFRISRKVVENLVYITLLQTFLLVAPLITYPYLVSVLGKELYGVIITAQVFLGYFTIIIDFGSNSVAARYIAKSNKTANELSEILSCILSARLYFWIVCSVVYFIFVYFVPSFRTYLVLYLLMFGMTLNDLLFPQFFFQGIEQMKHITQINIIIKTIFICLVFVFVKGQSDYLLVPIFYSIGYIAGGVISIIIIIHRYKVVLRLRSIGKVYTYVKDCSPILAKELISTIKDKLNVFFIGSYIGMSDVVVYDLGYKFIVILAKPITIIGTVLLPRFSQKSNRSKQIVTIWVSFSIVLACVLMINIFLDEIVKFFIHEQINIFPLRLFLIAPLFLSVSSCIGYVHLLANGLNKHILWSILLASTTYCVGIVYAIFSNTASCLMTFILISLFSYSVEMVYRMVVFIRNEK